MANIYDPADSGMFSVAPPMAPMPGALGRRFGRRPGMLSRLHPSHPIFKIMRGMLAARAGQPVPPGAPPPGPYTQPPVPGTTSGPQVSTGGQTDPAGQYPWMNIPKDLSGLNQWGPPPTPPVNEDPMATAQGHIRDRLMSRFHTAAPQQPALTSRHALQLFLQNAKRGQGARKPMLPLRRSQFRAY